jgi:hypothetical protein
MSVHVGVVVMRVAVRVCARFCLRGLGMLAKHAGLSASLEVLWSGPVPLAGCRGWESASVAFRPSNREVVRVFWLCDMRVRLCWLVAGIVPGWAGVRSAARLLSAASRSQNQAAALKDCLPATAAAKVRIQSLRAIERLGDGGASLLVGGAGMSCRCCNKIMAVTIAFRSPYHQEYACTQWRG